MITFKKSFQTTDGALFDNIEDAQVRELALLLSKMKSNVSLKETVSSPIGLETEIAAYISANKTAVIDILTMTANSKPKARAINGGTKKRVLLLDSDSDNK